MKFTRSPPVWELVAKYIGLSAMLALVWNFSYLFGYFAAPRAFGFEFVTLYDAIIPSGSIFIALLLALSAGLFLLPVQRPTFLDWVWLRGQQLEMVEDAEFERPADQSGGPHLPLSQYYTSLERVWCALLFAMVIGGCGLVAPAGWAYSFSLFMFCSGAFLVFAFRASHKVASEDDAVRQLYLTPAGRFNDLALLSFVVLIVVAIAAGFGSGHSRWNCEKSTQRVTFLYGYRFGCVAWSGERGVIFVPSAGAATFHTWSEIREIRSNDR